MQEYGFSLTSIFPYESRIVDSVLMQENAGKRKPVFSHILRSVTLYLSILKIFPGSVVWAQYLANVSIISLTYEKQIYSGIPLGNWIIFFDIFLANLVLSYVSSMVLEVIGTVFFFYKTYFNNKPQKQNHVTNIKPNIYKKDI